LTQKKPVSTYLYSVECALTIFYRDPKYQEWLNNMFNHMCNKTYEYLQNMEISEIDPDLRSLP
jgi:hypothetical protein